MVQTFSDAINISSSCEQELRRTKRNNVCHLNPCPIGINLMDHVIFPVLVWQHARDLRSTVWSVGLSCCLLFSDVTKPSSAAEDNTCRLAAFISV